MPPEHTPRVIPCRYMPMSPEVLPKIDGMGLAAAALPVSFWPCTQPGNPPPRLGKTLCWPS
jgi:hypothetical protein